MSENQISETLSAEEIHQIATKDDFHIAPYREDGETYGTLTWIWSVEVEGKLFVRAYNGTDSRWYNAALQQQEGKIKAAGMEKKVRFEPIYDNVINEQIDEAYRQKYHGSPYLKDMISERAKKATVQIQSFNNT